MDNPSLLAKLPPQVHASLVHGVATTVEQVFPIGVPIAAAAFLLSWLLPEVPLRRTIGTEAPLAVAPPRECSPNEAPPNEAPLGVGTLGVGTLGVGTLVVGPSGEGFPVVAAETAENAENAETDQPATAAARVP
ncbi:MAG: hypothetical protein ACRDYZ_00910 [Acidimicrobiales bacterium]